MCVCVCVCMCPWKKVLYFVSGKFRTPHNFNFFRKFNDKMATSKTQKQPAFQGSLWNTKLSQIKRTRAACHLSCQLNNSNLITTIKLKTGSFSRVLMKYKIVSDQKAVQHRILNANQLTVT